MTTPASLPPPAHEAALPPVYVTSHGTRVMTGVPYAALPGARPLELDLYLPATTTPAPIVVFLHGGGWRMGSRRSVGPSFDGVSPTPFDLFAQAGLAVASVDYRLSGEAVWPAQLHDAKAAVRWLRARGPEVGLDPGRIAAFGESAGGHLAALLGLTSAGHDGEVGIVGPSTHVTAVAAWYPPTDLVTVGSDPTSVDSREALLLGAALSAVPHVAAEASPVSHVRAGAPPFLLLHGAADRLIPATQSVRLADSLRAVGAEVELDIIEGADHLWLGTPEVARTALDRTIGFLRTRLST